MKVMAIAGAFVFMVATLAFAQSQPEEPSQIPGPAAPKPEDTKQPTITQSYQIKPGSRLRINLESNRSTGYQWRLARPVDQKVIKLVGSGYQSPEVKLPGAGGKEIWTFEAVAPGRTEIAMQYVRPWEKGVPPARTARFSVVVK
jgi:predicted secreted protein